MKYNFDILNERRNTNSLKWDVEKDMLPMWVADMDFKTAPCVIEAIKERNEQGIFGYAKVPDRYFESYQTWWKKHHGYAMKKEWMMFCTGVVPAISSIIRKLTTVGENVVIQAPVYNIFYNCILNNGRKVLSSDIIYENHSYHIDFDDLEEKLRDPQTTMMILCNPHNPIGLVWDKEVLERIGELCYTYNVIVISDEIHCDITVPAMSYTPFASINEHCAQNSIICLSASKTFNLAGLQSACIVVANDVLNHKVQRGLNTDEIAEPNTFACDATIAAFEKGEEWLLEMRAYIDNNKKVAQRFIEDNIPLLHYQPFDATYLMWVDCSAIGPFANQLCKSLRENQKLLISSGADFGKNGASFVRINIACPNIQMMEGLRRLKTGVEEFYEDFINGC